jgi:hypothetical protein
MPPLAANYGAWCSIIEGQIHALPDEITDPRGTQEGNYLNPLSLFGLFAVTAMLVCYALEKRNRWFILGFAGACALGSAYGFLQGAWPFGLIEIIWSVVALRRWWLQKRINVVSL